ncbi:MAG: PadR family transcriptional regulator [Acidobacteria bacterium]|nr:PadR family transcriptional regulator [Acidobacteriota bacterium]
MLHILLAIAGGAQHGYGIMREVGERTGGATELGAGTLYRSIKKMLDAGWIAEIDADEDNSLGPARREYRITVGGREVASSEVAQLNGIVEWARAAQLLDPGEPV